MINIYTKYSFTTKYKRKNNYDINTQLYNKGLIYINTIKK